ncbi:MAG: PTS sugar transporter subunit IIB [Elusimicrobiota bacterium]|jgi:mannose/fructose/N-acetylgalactosamine-specific phosphotransferase system component IIB|nr:PTS sugar transporter subunit IIB [Elusimicrobiota bacterium]
MAISIVRIDDRLIHGQIIQGWLQGSDISALAVASDAAAKDIMWQNLMSMSVPEHIELKVASVENLAEIILSGYFENKNAMLLISCPKDILTILKKGLKIDSINVGGMRYSEGKNKVLYNIYADDGDIADLKEISLMGIALEGRLLPKDEKIDVAAAIKKYEGK